ncbi:MAG: fimbria/pilus periplasmic chaperone [Pseudomonadota bacterium]
MRYHWIRFYAHGLFTLALCGSYISAARAQFVIEPLRAVLTEETQSAAFTLVNTADRLLHVDVSMVDLEATLEGYRPAQPDHRTAVSAAPWLTLYPATLTLEPGERQTIRVDLRTDQPQPHGHERRTHLYVEASPPRAGVRKVSDRGIGLDLGVGVSVPVLVRPSGALNHAPPSEKPVRFEDTSLVRGADGSILLTSTLTSGAEDVDLAARPRRSVYGAICVAGAAGTAKACLQNIALYPDAPGRRITLDLKTDALGPGLYRLTYEGRAEDGGRALARENFRVE